MQCVLRLKLARAVGSLQPSQPLGDGPTTDRNDIAAMEPPESDDLSQLMPNLQQQAREQAASPTNTTALREYIQVLGERPDNVPAASTMPHKPRTDGLELRAGSGRRPNRRYFTIKLRPAERAVEDDQAAEEQAPVDPEALKDALVEQAQAQRRALVEAARRPGTGRVPRRREFAVTLPPLVLEDEAAEAEEAAALAAALAEQAALAAELEADELLHQADMEALGLMEEQEAGPQRWEDIMAEEGVLAEHAGAPLLRPANAATPGAPLRGGDMLEEQGGSCEVEPATGLAAAGAAHQEQPEPGSSQRAQARTPGSSLAGRYTPMEGVPERLALLATRGKAAPGAAHAAPSTAVASRFGRMAATPAGFTPLEGIPERLMGLPAMPGATRLGSNGSRRRSVDSPVEGLVQQGAARRAPSAVAEPARMADANGDDGFGGFAALPQPEQAAAVHAAPSPRALPAPVGLLHEQQAAAADGVAAADGQDDYDDDMGDGGFDDGGYFDEEPEPADGVDAAVRAEAGVQTGASLDAEAAPGGSQGAAPAEQELPGDHGLGHDDGFGAGFDDGGYEAAELAEASAAAARREQRRTKNPGSRLRNECKRKSLAADGRHEVRPGVRRSTRQREEPLKWWLNEKKEFGRSHRTMPTVNNVVHTVPTTPWQTVTDIKRRPAKKQRAPTPHDLEGQMEAMAAEEEEQTQPEEEDEQQEEQQPEEEQQEEEVQEAAASEPEAEPEQQRRRPGSGGRRSAAVQQQEERPQRAAAGRRQGREAAAAAPPARGKATKKAAAKAAGGSKQRRARR